MRICRGWRKALCERKNDEDAPFDTLSFDTLRYSGSGASNKDNGSLKLKNGNVLKSKSLRKSLPERVEGGSLIKAPFDTLRYSGSGTSNYAIGSQKPKIQPLKKVNVYTYPLPEPVEGNSPHFLFITF